MSEFFERDEGASARTAARYATPLDAKRLVTRFSSPAPRLVTRFLVTGPTAPPALLTPPHLGPLRARLGLGLAMAPALCAP
jgi:hypothetical protein